MSQQQPAVYPNFFSHRALAAAQRFARFGSWRAQSEFTPRESSQETGAALLYHGQAVSLEWQFLQAIPVKLNAPHAG